MATLVDSGVSGTSGATSRTPTLASGPATAGNLLIAGVCLAATDGGWGSDPDGWTLLYEIDADFLNGKIFYKVSDGSESSVTISWTTSRSCNSFICEYALDGEEYDAKAQNTDNVETSVTSQASGTATAAGSGVAIAVFSVLTSNGWDDSATNSVDNSFTIDRVNVQATGRPRNFVASKDHSSGSVSTTLTTTDTGSAAHGALLLFSSAGGGAVSVSSTATFTLTGSAAGAVQVAGASAAAVSLTGTATGAVAVTGASAATVSLAGTAEVVVGNAPATGESAGTFNLAGTGVASVLVDGFSAATITVSGTAEGTVTGGLETRYGRPTTDTSAGSWLPSTGSDLYAMLDEETAEDADYIYAESATTAVLKCTSLDLAGMTTPVLRMKVPTGFTAAGTLTLGLYQGNSPGALVATIEETDPAAGLYEHQLTAGEMANITDGSDLYFRVTAA